MCRTAIATAWALVRVRVRFSVTVSIRVRVTRGGGYFLRLYTPFPVVGGQIAYSVIVNHKTGSILIRSSLSSQSPDFMILLPAALSVFD